MTACRRFIGDEELIETLSALAAAAQNVLDRGYVSAHIDEERADHMALKNALASVSVTLSRPDTGGKEAAGEGRISAVREKLRLRMLEQPISEERNTYSDGYAGGLMDAIGMLDDALQSLPARPGVDRGELCKTLRDFVIRTDTENFDAEFEAEFADAVIALIGQPS